MRFLQGVVVGVALLVSVIVPLSAEEPQPFIIDTPTTDMLGYGGYDVNFRLFSNGGILTRFNFGVFKAVNLGFGWELSNVIGSEDVTVGPPTLHLQIRPYSGGMVMPAFAFGYDGQGYGYNRDDNEFTQKEKGVYMVFGREVFTPGLQMNLGANMNDFRESKVYGFANMRYNVDDIFLFLAEYDNVNYLPDARLNLGVRFYVVDDLSIDLAGRDIGAAGRSTERIVRISYVGKF